MFDPIRRSLIDILRARAERQRQAAAEDERRGAERRELADALDLVALRLGDGGLSDDEARAALAAAYPGGPIGAFGDHATPAQQAERLCRLFAPRQPAGGA